MPNKRDFLSVDDLSPAELVGLLDEADEIKARPEAFAERIAGRQVLLIFEKPSTRTRVSFEVAVTSMGGHALVLRSDELQLGRGETIGDTGRVLSGYADAIVLRTFGQDRLELLAEAAAVPVVNALSDFSHPCQALADLQSIREQKGTLEGLALAYLGDGNNVAHSLMFAGAKVGMDVRVASPPGYEPSAQVAERSSLIGAETGGRTTVTNVVAEAASGADVLYTDVWASMGQESQSGERAEILAHYRLDGDAVDLAKEDVIVMHCLPAHRDEEIAAEVLDGPHSVVWDQAANRLHTQKALLAWLLG
ncbi:MAG: ornithine carbamoyltransferase [Actinobacteria bacterium]|nr:ornithine carbamoyltransferase [Actinomycetota bacterium]MDQ3533387.1 ornithine carbamoyltransferase [Actinomycetota bacterium]